MKKLCSFLLLLLGVSRSVWGIDLVPRFLTQESDGTAINRPYFVDGDRKYAVKLDSQTRILPFGDGALFKFEKFPDARMQLLHSPVEPGPFSADRLPLCETAARKLLPENAEQVVLVAATPDPLPINNWQSYRYTFSYRSAAQARRQSITFLNLDPTTEIVMQVAAREENFDKIEARSFNIIRRWHEVPPDSVTRYN